jgi:3-oxoacyl-[acyl-carrier protein] reductase
VTPDGRRVALVTGGASGIGLATCAALAGGGCAVAASWHRQEPPADRSWAWHRADLTDDDARTSLVEAVAGTVGSIDVLVCGAARLDDRSLARPALAELRQALELHVVAATHLVTLVAPGMRRDGWGRVVLLSSAGALLGNAGQAAYQSSKAALVGLARVAARELGPAGVTVNVVSPGPVRGGMLDALSPAVTERLVADVPLGRFGEPAEVAAAVAFLSSDAAGAITGAVVPVDGGFSA